MTCYYAGKYKIGTEPTYEEFQIYDRVKTFNQKENIAVWLNSNHYDLTQEQFELMHDIYDELCMCDGENDWELLGEAYDKATEDAE